MRSDLAQRTLRRYRSDGLRSTLDAVGRYPLRAARRRAEDIRAFRGKRHTTLQTALRHRVHRLRYEAPADPYRRISVAPDEIEHKSGGFKRAFGLGQIRGGDWDRPEQLVPVEYGWVYVGLRQRFEEGRDWRETVYYETARRRFRGGESVWGYESLDQFRRVRCAYVDDLFESIRREGYHPRETASLEPPTLDCRRGKYTHYLDPLVLVGRDGEVLLRDGRHWFAIARILGIESLPVNVLGRHPEWQRRRDDVAAAETRSELGPALRARVDHPDLTDVAPEPSDDR
jgi:hypothetical protein